MSKRDNKIVNFEVPAKGIVWANGKMAYIALKGTNIVSVPVKFIHKRSNDTASVGIADGFTYGLKANKEAQFIDQSGVIVTALMEEVYDKAPMLSFFDLAIQ